MHTVIAVFDEPRAAQAGADRLLQAGFAPEDVHLEGGGAGAPETSSSRIRERTLATAEREIAVGPQVLTQVEHFFDRLLGAGEHARHARAYSEAVQRGGTVVVADAADAAQADAAAAVLHELGAVDITERAEQWGAAGWSAPGAASAGAVHWRTARVVHRASGPRLGEIVRGPRENAGATGAGGRQQEQRRHEERAHAAGAERRAPDEPDDAPPRRGGATGR